MQSPDVAIIDPFKEKRDRIEREWTQKNPKRKVTRELKIKFAGQALRRAYPNKVLRHSFKGFVPWIPTYCYPIQASKTATIRERWFPHSVELISSRLYKKLNLVPAIPFG